MARIMNNGKPTTKTAGVIGDIYIDKQTGLVYRCTFAYGVGNDREYAWTETHDIDIPNEVAADEEPEVATVSEEPTVIDDETDISDVARPKRNNYRSHYKNNKH